MIGRKKDNASHWFFKCRIPFKDFSERAINRGPHNSGWGVGWQENGKWRIFKEGKEDVKKYNFDKINEVNSKIIFIHLRHASVGDETTKNAHPFSYKNYIFEHNGGVAIKEIKKCLNKKFIKEIKTDTDSEVFFLLIMQFLEETKDVFKAIRKTLEIVKKYPYRSLNFLMSDGKKVYAFREVSPEHKDKEDYYCLHYLKQKDKVIFSSDALSKEGWTSLRQGEMIEVGEDLKFRSVDINRG